MRSISQVFIEHPRAAWVVSILIALCGGICLSRMPVAEYPNITPVTITVSCTYTGAGTKDLSDSVATILEDEINGVEDIWYYKSNCSNKGLYNCYCTFRPGTPSNVALMNVQNAVKRAEPKLPTEVTQNGITVKKRPEDRMVMYCFLTDGREMDIMELSNFVEKQVADAIARLDGVGQVETSGRTYSMRIWLDPIRLAGLNIQISEIKSAIESQNIQAAAGTVGGEYANKYLTFKLNVRGRLKTKEEFENIVIRSNPETGAQVLVKDVARVELGCKGYTIRSRFNEHPVVYLEVYKSPDANSVETAARVKAEVDKWIGRMPAGVQGVLADDSTAFTLVFLKETFKTLVVALILVILITYLFLQDWRATFVPAIAIPISLLGAFAFLYPMGYTLNVLTMFGLILVIGSLVDDAIVVVENCQALMIREGLSPKEAASKSMGQITGAIIATTAARVLLGHDGHDVRAVRGDDVHRAVPVDGCRARPLAGPLRVHAPSAEGAALRPVPAVQRDAGRLARDLSRLRPLLRPPRVPDGVRSRRGRRGAVVDLGARPDDVPPQGGPRLHQLVRASR